MQHVAACIGRQPAVLYYGVNRSRMKKLFAGLVLLTIAGRALADDGFSLSTGLDYSTGKYGNAVSTDILYVPVIGKYAADRLSLMLTIPYISITGPGGVIQGYGRMVSPAGGTGFGRSARGGGLATSTNSGLGDVIASAGYVVYAADALSLDVVGKIKFGTADANKGLGTGENDYSAQVDGSFRLLGQTSLFATAGYKVVGAPVGIATNNVAFGTLGVNQQLSDDTNAGAMVNAAQSAFVTGGAQRDVTVYASQNLSRSTSVQASLLKGFADGSPDYGGRVMITGMF